MKTFFSLLILAMSSTTFAQYQVLPCKAESVRGQVCIQKKDHGVEEFSAREVLEFQVYVQDHPGLPWLKLIEKNGQLTADLIAAAPKIRPAEKARYEELITKIKKRPDTASLLEATSILLGSRPGQSYYFSSKDKTLMRKFVNVLTPSQPEHLEISNFNYKHCKPNPARYEIIVKQQDRCSTLEKSVNSESLYSALAEIASCDDYGVVSAGTLSAPEDDPEANCIVRLSDISASVGGGTIEVKASGSTYQIEWLAGHDLSGKKNDVKYWRDQLEPQVQKVFLKASNNGTGRFPASLIPGK